MKFVSGKQLRDHAYRLHRINVRRVKLLQTLKQLEAERAALESFLKQKAHENFQFASPKGYLMEADFVPWLRRDINDAAVRRFYAKMGKKVPMKTSEGVHLKVKYITE